jgi:predicted alpha/beta hydrolase family esterase
MQVNFENNYQELKFLTLPGLFGSNKHHWQSRWEKKFGFQRVEQQNWQSPHFDSWSDTLINHLDENQPDNGSILIAHSLGCHLVIKSFPVIATLVKGVLLVAPPDLQSGYIKQELSSFATTFIRDLNVPGYLIYSENDPYASTTYSIHLGTNLGLQPISVGYRGHINSDSQLDNWREGLHYLDSLMKVVNEIDYTSVSN